MVALKLRTEDWERSTGRRSDGATSRTSQWPARPAAVSPTRAWRLRRVGPANPMRSALIYTGLPALLLVIYVALWTGAMRGGYQKQQLENRIAQLRVENDSLQARVRELQSPRSIVPQATQLGMQPAPDVEYVMVRRKPASR